MENGNMTFSDIMQEINNTQSLIKNVEEGFKHGTLDQSSSHLLILQLLRNQLIILQRIADATPVKP